MATSLSVGPSHVTISAERFSDKSLNPNPLKPNPSAADRGRNVDFQYKIASESQPRVGRFQKRRHRNSDSELGPGSVGKPPTNHRIATKPTEHPQKLRDPAPTEERSSTSTFAASGLKAGRSPAQNIRLGPNKVAHNDSERCREVSVDKNTATETQTLK